LLEAVGEAELSARFTTVIRQTLFILEPNESTEIVGTIDEGQIRAPKASTPSRSTRSDCCSGKAIRRRSTEPGCVFSKSRRCVSRRGARQSAAGGSSKVRPPNRAPNTSYLSTLNPK